MSIEEKLLGAPASGGGFPGENFKAITYTGNGATQSITGVGFKPDLVMIKPRTDSDNWNIFDSTRGVTEQLLPNTTAGESTQANSLQSFDIDGFSLGTDNNSNKDTILYSAWCWKANGGTTASNGTGDITSTVQANTAAGFSIVKWTGNASSTQTVGHGLSSAPEWMVVKNLNTGEWVWKNDVQLGAARGIYLNDSAGEVTDTTFWQSASPTSTVFTVGSSSLTNGSGNEMIAYCWHSVSEFSNSTTGSQYIGTGDSNGPIVDLGFEPSIILIKSKDGSPATNWLLYTQETDEYLSVDNTNTASASAGTYKIDFLSNGFKVSGSGGGINASGQSYNYYCWAKDPDTEVPELAASFSARTYVGTGTDDEATTGLGFKPNMVWFKTRNQSNDHNLSDSVRGATKQVRPNRTLAEQGATDLIKSFDTDGFTLGTGGDANANDDTYIAWAWKANDDEPAVNDNGSIDSIVSVNANAGFSIVKWTGTYTTTTVGHGLSAVPEIILSKNLTTAAPDGWPVYSQSIGNDYTLFLNSTAASTSTAGTWGSTDPTSTVFTVETNNANNQSGNEIIAYCFHSVAGYSKIGSYTGDGLTGQVVTVGFQPDWILIKSTVGSSNWVVYDTIRGINAGGYLEPNRSDADDLSDAPNITITSTGFEITAGGVTVGLNASPNLYIYAAFRNNTAMNTTLEESFNIVTYTGTGTTARPITGLGFSPDLVWMKGRSQVDNNYWQDSIRTAPVRIYSNSDVAQYSPITERFTSFDADGFTIGDDNSVNMDTETYVTWCWKAGQTWNSSSAGSISSVVSANTANGFSVVRYTGIYPTVGTVGHGLSSTPELIIIKNLPDTSDWEVYSETTGNTGNLIFNDTDAFATNSGFMNDTSPTASVFTVGNDGYVNGVGDDMIAYCFHSVAGFSKIGTYTGSATAVTVTTGFKTDFVMIKRTNGTGSWNMIDALRGGESRLYANADSSETVESSDYITFLATGFRVDITSNTDLNNTGDTFIYAAFAKNVASNTTLENSFKTVIYSGNGSSQSIGGVGFQADLVWIKERSGTNPNVLYDSLRGAGKLITSGTDAAQSGNAGDLMGAFETDGFQVNRNYLIHTAHDTTNGSASLDYVAWCWKAGGTWQSNASGSLSSTINVNTANGFSIVKYTGTGSTATYGHGLSAAPEFIIIKKTSGTQNWNAGDDSTGWTKYFDFNTDGAAGTETTVWNDTAPSSTVVTLGGSNNTNANGEDYIMYCWHSVTEYSKIGTYAGTGGSFTVPCGFQPDYVMIKRTDSTGNWVIVDSVRDDGDDRLYANNNVAEDTGQGETFKPTGFSPRTSTTNDTNTSGGTYIFMAFKMN